MPHDQIAIIGAGLSGLTLALAFHQVGITSTVYESRPEPLNIGGAVMLSPNALKILDALGLYDDVSSKGYKFELLDYKMADGTLIDTYEFGNHEKYGYKANRIYRHELINAVLNKLHASGVKVNYGHKFSHIVHEGEHGVTWEFAGGSQATASLLIGADGIHSTVRKYLYPDLEPKFVGSAGWSSAVPASQIDFQESKPITQPLTIVHKELGAFVLAPQKVDGSEYFIGRQKRMSDQTREGWDKIFADKAAVVKFLQSDAEAYGQVVVSATSRISEDKVNIWPFYMIPKLDKWISDKHRVVIMGDGAHAVPPSAGQGINQAFEDVYMFAILLAETRRPGTNISFRDAVSFWQQYRQDRIDKILDLNRKIDLRRLPESQRSDNIDTSDNEEEIDLNWLYEPDFKGVVDAWMNNQTSY